MRTGSVGTGVEVTRGGGVAQPGVDAIGEGTSIETGGKAVGAGHAPEPGIGNRKAAHPDAEIEEQRCADDDRQGGSAGHQAQAQFVAEIGKGDEGEGDGSGNAGHGAEDGPTADAGPALQGEAFR